MAYEILEIGGDPGALRRPVIERGKIAPNGLARRVGRIGGEGRDDFAAPVMGKPFRVVRRSSLLSFEA